MTLNDLREGQSATILALSHEGPRLQRLLEMGLFEGTPVTLMRRAPLGDPIEIKIGDFSLSLRCEDAKLVEVSL